MNYDMPAFSSKLSVQRLSQAKSLLGEKITKKILAYALFLLGASRSAIASYLCMPPGSVRSVVLSINNRGLMGLEDQRTKKSSFKPIRTDVALSPILKVEDTFVKVFFRTSNQVLQIPDSNQIQKRVILLSLLSSGILKRSEVAAILDLSADRTGKLARKLDQEDVKSILDQRQGHKHDYRFTPEIKAELIQQFVLELVANRPTGGEQLARKLQDRCQLTLSARSILNHVSKLGLPNIKCSLVENLTALKKNP
jgi:hypothetical protein